MSSSNQTARVNILGSRVDAITMQDAVATTQQALAEKSKGYICVTGVHGIMEARRDRKLSRIFDHAMMVVPDGMPTVWVGHLQGHRHMERVAGPDLMLEIFKRAEFRDVTHFFYGGKEGIADELSAGMKQRFPWLRILGSYTPPYRELSNEEEAELVRQVHVLKPDIIWVGISTPRQEEFMTHLLPKLSTTLMFGVGAAFDFHTGRIKDSPAWVKRAGLQWLHRVIQDPRRLWKRYLINNSAFLWQMGLQFAGVRRYPAGRSNDKGAKGQDLLIRKAADPVSLDS